MPYNELLKNFSKIRDYMRDFYIYGFRTRSDFGGKIKSARSYDNERRRVESWLGGVMSFRRDAAGKSVFLSVDNRTVPHNPLYRAFRTKSFTDNDIMLHFYILDILADGEALSFRKIADRIAGEYLSYFDAAEPPDDSTVRNKLKEYTALGLLKTERRGREMLYSINQEKWSPKAWQDVLAFASEAMPLGVVGSFLLDRYEKSPEYFSFKHHYLFGALDAEILEELMLCRRERRRAEITFRARRSEKDMQAEVFPLRIYVSTRTGRENLLAYNYQIRRPGMYRLDHIRKVKALDSEPDYERLERAGRSFAEYLWGTSSGPEGNRETEHVEMTLYVGKEERFIVDRLEREKRNGTVSRLDETTYLYQTDVYDAQEMLPWIRTFTGRIIRLECSNDSVVRRFYDDFAQMQQMYETEAADI